MKNTTHTSKWAMALCAAALFSFTAIATSQARMTVGEPTPPKDTVQPVPAPAPDQTTTTTSPVGTSTGTVMVD